MCHESVVNVEIPPFPRKKIRPLVEPKNAFIYQSHCFFDTDQSALGRKSIVVRF